MAVLMAVIGRKVGKRGISDTKCDQRRHELHVLANLCYP